MQTMENIDCRTGEVVKVGRGGHAVFARAG